MSQAYQLSAPHPQSPLQRPNVMAMPSSHQHPFQPKPRTKNRQSLKNLAWVELSMSIAMFLLDIIAIVAIINGKGKPSPPCGMGTGIWVGLLGMITAGLGAGAFWNPYANKCLLVSHFVMSIIMTLADAVLIIFSVICQISLPYFLRAGQFSDAATEDHIEGMIWLEFFLLTAGVTHWISSIVTTAFICRHWCQNGEPPVTVITMPEAAPAGGTGSSSGYEQQVVIEQLPSNIVLKQSSGEEISC